VPFYAIFASIGFLALGHSIIASKIQNRSTQFPEIILISLGIVAAFIITLLNIWQSAVLSQKHSRQSPPALLLQAAQMSADETGGGPHLFYVGNDIGSKPQYNHASEYYAKLVYSIHNIPLDRFTFISFNDILLPENAICQSADQPAIAIITTKIQNAGYIASKINECWPGAELRLIKDVNKTAIHYRLINESALPFINSVDGYWIEEEMPQTVLTQSSEKRSDWAVYQPVGISQNSKGQLAVVEAATKQVVFLDSNGRVKNILGNVFANPSDISFLPDDGFVIADTDRGLLWFDANGHFRFMSNGGEKPRGLSVAADGTVYVAPAGNQFIIQLGNNGELLRTIEGPQFEQPTSIAVAVDGRIAVGDPVAGKIFVSSNNGELLSEYPIGVGDTSIGKPGLLWLQNGSLIFTDPANNRIIWVDPKGKTLKEWSNLKSPTDIILQSTNKLLVLECYDNRIALIELK
jgi:hypothetical protein